MSYYSNYGLYDCWKCLCEVCTRVHCPKYHKDSKLHHCVAMRQRCACPTIKCDFFMHKEKHTIFRVRRKQRKIDTLVSKLDAILEKLNIDKRGGNL